jgi:type IV secretion system protein VirB10
MPLYGSPVARSGLPLRSLFLASLWRPRRIGLVISVLEDASEIASRSLAGTGSNTTQVPGQTGETVLQNTMQIRPVLRKNQGGTASIFVAKDFDFRSVYDVGLRR